MPKGEYKNAINGIGVDTEFKNWLLLSEVPYGEQIYKVIQTCNEANFPVKLEMKELEEYRVWIYTKGIKDIYDEKFAQVAG